MEPGGNLLLNSRSSTPGEGSEARWNRPVNADKSMMRQRVTVDLR